MTEFRIIVIVDPSKAQRGTKQVEQSLNRVGTAADRTRQLIARAFAFVGVAVGIRQLVGLSDTFTNVQNRIKTVTDGTAELNLVTKELFAISNRTRGSFAATAEVFSRAALAVRELGITQQETLAFTESLNQAVILSGAGAQEANNALIQLSQGLASGTLRGDELRSVLEQLPVVADVIAKSLGVTRGELRILGEEGVISAKAIIRAFAEAREELTERFAETVPTIAQSFTILENQAIRLIGSFSEAGGVFSTIASSIQSVATGIGVLNNNLDTATDIFSALAIVALSRFLGPFISRLSTGVTAQVAFTRAIASGNAVMIEGVQADLMRAQSTAKVTTARAAEAAALVRSLQARTANLRVLLAEANAERLSVATKIELQAGIAAVTGRTQVLNRLRATQTALLQREVQATQLLSIAKVELAATTGASAAAATVATGAQTALQGALVRTTLVARGTAAVMGLLRGVLALVGGPAGLLVLAAGAMFLFGRETRTAKTEISEQASELEALNLRLETNIGRTREANIELQNQATARLNNLKITREEATVAVSLLLVQIALQKEQVALLAEADAQRQRRPSFLGADIGSFVKLNAANVILNNLETALREAIAASVGADISIIRLQTNIGNFAGTVKEVANKALDDLRAKLNGVFKAGLQVRRMSKLLEIQIKDENITREEANRLLARQRFLLRDQLDPLGALNRELDFENSLLSKSVGEREVLNRTRQTTLELQRAGIQISREEVEEIIRLNLELQRQAEFQLQTRDLERETTLLGLNNDERTIQQALFRAEDTLKRTLTDTERELVITLVQQNLELERQNEVLARIEAPLRNYEEGLKALVAIRGDISTEEFTKSLRELRLAFLDTQTDGASGLERGIIRLQTEFEDIASLVETTVVKAFKAAEDALVQFVTTGKLDFNSLINSILADLTRLAIRQAITGPLAALLGTGGGGGGTGLLGALKGLLGIGGGGGGSTGPGGGGVSGFGIPGLDHGGSFPILGNAGVDRNVLSVNNRPVARVSRGETVTVTPNNGSGGRPIQVNMNISTPDVNSFRRSQDQIAAQLATTLSRAQRRDR